MVNLNEAKGQCFSYVYNWALKHPKEEMPVIVHGFLTNPEVPGHGFWHAWVEDKGLVYDWQTEQKGEKPMRYFKFYALYKPKDMKRYTPAEVIEKSIQTGHQGPWHPFGESLSEGIRKQDVRYFEDLPDYEPTAKVQAVLKQYGFADYIRWKVEKDKRASSMATTFDLIVMNERDRGDIEAELHELGHVMYGLVDRSWWRSAYDYYRKNAPVSDIGKDWKVISGTPIYFGFSRGKDSMSEFFADMFKAFVLKKLEGKDFEVMDTMLRGAKKPQKPQTFRIGESLDEAKRVKLYHGTWDIDDLLSKGFTDRNKSGGLASMQLPGTSLRVSYGVHGIHLTRNLDVARHFAYGNRGGVVEVSVHLRNPVRVKEEDIEKQKRAIEVYFDPDHNIFEILPQDPRLREQALIHAYALFRMRQMGDTEAKATTKAKEIMQMVKEKTVQLEGVRWIPVSDLHNYAKYVDAVWWVKGDGAFFGEEEVTVFNPRNIKIEREVWRNNVEESLEERSFDPKDIPRNYRMGFSVSSYKGVRDDVMQQLSNMEMKGVRGISGDPTISIRFFGDGKNAMLVMNGQELVKENKISRIMYDNPHYLMQDNMAALARLVQTTDANNSHTFDVIVDRLFSRSRKNKSLEFEDISYRLSGIGYDLLQAWKSNSPKIDNVFQMVKWLKKVGFPAALKNDPHNIALEKLIDFPDNKLAAEVTKSVQELGDDYQDEGEWLLKDQTLHIPPKSRLFIMRDKVPERPKDWAVDVFGNDEQKLKDAWIIANQHIADYYNMIQQAIDKYKLDDKYTIVDVAPEDWKKVQNKFFTKYTHGRRPRKVESLEEKDDEPLDLPDVIQQKRTTCGVAAMRSIMQYFGVTAPSEDDLAKEADTNADGTTPKSIVRTLEKHGITAKLETEMSLDELNTHIESGRPVIVAYQAWKTDETSWEDDWKDGHYSIVVSVDKDNIVLEDPSAKGRRITIPSKEFEQRWHDAVRTGERLRRAGIVVSGPIKEANNKYIKMWIVTWGDDGEESFTDIKKAREFAKRLRDEDDESPRIRSIEILDPELWKMESLNERLSDIKFQKFADRITTELTKSFEEIQKHGSFHRYFHRMPNGWYATELDQFTPFPRRLYLAFVPDKSISQADDLGAEVKGAYGHIAGSPVIFLSGVSLSALEDVLGAVWGQVKQPFVHELVHYYDETLYPKAAGKGPERTGMGSDKAWEIYLRRSTERNAYVREIINLYFDRTKMLREKGKDSKSTAFEALIGRNAKDFYDTVRNGFYKDTLDQMEKSLKPRQWRAVQKRIVELYDELKRFVDGELPESVAPSCRLLTEQEAINFDKTDLQKEYDAINKKAFDGKLPKIPLRWSKSKRTGGWVHAKHYPRTGEIKIEELTLSRFYKITREQFLGLLAHEMIHVEKFAKGIAHEIGGDHGPVFQNRCDQVSKMIGVPVPYKEVSHDLGLDNPKALKPFEILVMQWKGKSDKAYVVSTEGKFTSSIKEIKNSVMKGFDPKEIHVTIYRSTNPTFVRTPLVKKIFSKYGFIRLYRMGEEVHNALTGAEIVFDEYWMPVKYAGVENRTVDRDSLLVERSFGPEDVPRNYRVIFNLMKGNDEPNKETCKQLANMKLEGVRGISDDPTISIQFLGIARDAMLVMNGQELLKANKITRIMYDNPHYLMQDNMTALARIFSSENVPNRSHAVNNLFRYFFAALDQNDKDVGKFAYAFERSSPAQDLVWGPWEKRPRKIDNVHDIVKWLKEVGIPAMVVDKTGRSSLYNHEKLWSEFGELPIAVLEKWMLKALEQIGKVYKGEGEWLLKNSILNIPKNSRLFILRPTKESVEPDAEDLRIAGGDYERAMKFVKMRNGYAVENYAAVNAAVKDYGLESKYRVIFAAPTEWDDLRKKYFRKYPQGREGRKRGESTIETGSMLDEARGKKSPWNFTQRDLPKDAQKMVTTINKAIKHTQTMVKVQQDVEASNYFGHTIPDTETPQMRRVWYDRVKGYDEWIRLITQVHKEFNPENVSFTELPPDYTTWEKWQQKVDELQTEWTVLFGQYRSGGIFIPPKGEAGRYGLSWMQSLLHEPDFEGKGGYVDGEKLGKAFNSLRMVVDGFPPDKVLKALRRLKEVVLNMFELLMTKQPQTYQDKVGPFNVSYIRTGLDDPNPVTKAFIEKCHEVVKQAQEFLERSKVKSSYYVGPLRFVQNIETNANGYYNANKDLVVVEFKYGDESIKSMTATLIHELAHRVWYKIPARAQKAWANFINLLNKPLMPATREFLQWKIDQLAGQSMKPDAALEMTQEAFPELSNLLADLTYYFKYNGSRTPVYDALLAIHKKGTPKGLPTSYAGVSPIEAFPEVFADTVYPYFGEVRTAEKTDPFVAAELKKMLEGKVLESVDTDRESLTEAKTIMWHGTSSKFEHNILSVGFAPQPKTKTWGAGTGARESYPGTYFTNNFMTARSSAQNTTQKVGGNSLLVAAQIETRAKNVVLDEDHLHIDSTFNFYLSRKHHLVGPNESNTVALYLWSGDVKIDWQDFFNEFVDSLQDKYPSIPRERWERVFPYFKKMYEAYFAYLVSRFKVRESENERGNDETVLLQKYDYDRYVEQYGKFPEFDKARKEYRSGVDTFLAKASDLSVMPKDRYLHNVRVMDPVGFSGANRILGVFEVEYLGLNNPYYEIIYVDYLKDVRVAEALIEQEKQHVGDTFKVVYRHGTRGPAYDNPEPVKKPEQ